MKNVSIECSWVLFFKGFSYIALKREIEVIPIKGMDISWGDLNRIDLTEEDLGYFDLGREKGIEFNLENFSSFCDNLYKYIKQYKRNINLM